MENLNALADIANTKAAPAAKTPMPPPPTTTGTSGKKRKRSEAAIARDKLVTSKRCQTFKLWEALEEESVIDDPKDVAKLKKWIKKMKTLEAQGWEEINKGPVAEVDGMHANYRDMIAQVQKLKEHYEKEKQRYTIGVQEGLMASSSWRELKCFLMQQKMELAEQKMGLMQDREEWQKAIREEREWKEKYEKVYEEVKELRKLKYAADRKAKGPVGVAR